MNAVKMSTTFRISTMTNTADTKSTRKRTYAIVRRELNKGIADLVVMEGRMTKSYEKSMHSNEAKAKKIEEDKQTNARGQHFHYDGEAKKAREKSRASEGNLKTLNTETIPNARSKNEELRKELKKLPKPQPLKDSTRTKANANPTSIVINAAFAMKPTAQPQAGSKTKQKLMPTRMQAHKQALCAEETVRQFVSMKKPANTISRAEQKRDAAFAAYEDAAAAEGIFVDAEEIFGSIKPTTFVPAVARDRTGAAASNHKRKAVVSPGPSPPTKKTKAQSMARSVAPVKSDEVVRAPGKKRKREDPVRAPAPSKKAKPLAAATTSPAESRTTKRKRVDEDSSSATRVEDAGQEAAPFAPTTASRASKRLKATAHDVESDDDHDNHALYSIPPAITKTDYRPRGLASSGNACFSNTGLQLINRALSADDIKQLQGDQELDTFGWDHNDLLKYDKEEMHGLTTQKERSSAKRRQDLRKKIKAAAKGRVLSISAHLGSLMMDMREGIHEKSSLGVNATYVTPMMFQESFAYGDGDAKGSELRESMDGTDEHDVDEYTSAVIDAVATENPDVAAHFKVPSKTVLNCNSCGETSSSDDPPETTVRIHVPNQKESCKFTNLLRQTVCEGNGELLSDFTCETCSLKATTTRGVEYGELPKNLLVSINRAEAVNEKILTALDLDFGDIELKGHRYRMIAMAGHLSQNGQTSGQGHYTAVSLHGSQWYELTTKTSLCLASRAWRIARAMATRSLCCFKSLTISDDPQRASKASGV